MSKPIYLFKEHENFQPRKTKLQKGAIFQRHITWLVLGIPVSLALIWLAGSTFRQAWPDLGLISIFSATFGGLGMMACFGLLSRNRLEQFQYGRLCRSNIVIEAKVRKVAVAGGAKSNYKYADYRFTSPDMGVLSGQIRSGRGYGWPRDIQVGDTLHILYFDNKTYCVL